MDTDELLVQVAPPLHPDDRDKLLVDMARRLGRIEANTDTVVKGLADHDSRIRDLEQRQWQIPGIGIFVSLLALFGIHPH